MSSGCKVEIENLLKKLNEFAKTGRNEYEEQICDIVVDLSEVLVSPLASVDYDLCISLLLGKDGLIDFCKHVASDGKLKDAKKNSLDLMKSILDKDSSHISRYSDELQKLCRQLYNADKSADVKCSALDLFSSLIKSCTHHINFQDFNIDQFIERLCLDIRGNKGSRLLYQQLRTLGILTYAVPEKVTGKSSLIYKVLKEQLLKRTSGKQTDLTAAAGAVRGLTFYFHNFPEGQDDSSKFYSDIYPHLHKILNPKLKLPKREVQRAVLELIHYHGAKFSEDLFNNYEQLFGWLVEWCYSRNRDDHKAAIPAMDTFVVVIGNVIELQANENNAKSIHVFKFLLQAYNKLLETSNSSSQISLAVKGYGLLAGSCRIFLSPDDVFKMFTRVMNVSHQAFFQSSEMLENKLTNLPSYIESLGIIICKMDTVSSNVVDSVLQLTLALTENFSYVSQFKWFLAYRALYTIIAALRDKTDIYRMFLHSFVYQFILQTCSHLPVIETEITEGVAEEQFDENISKWTSVAGLKGDLANYKSFMPLWTALLNPEKASSIRVSGRATSHLTEISCQMYCEFIECILEIAEKLDLETYRSENQQGTIEDSETASFTDPVTGLQARTPKDFQVYMNLSSLIEEVLPLQCDSQLTHHFIRLLLYFIQKSSAQPLVSTHYSVIANLLIAGRKAKYFQLQVWPVFVRN